MTGWTPVGYVSRPLALGRMYRRSRRWAAARDALDSSAAGFERLGSPGSNHAASCEEGSLHRRADASWTQDRTHIPDAAQRFPARRRLLLLPDLWVEREVGEERPRHGLLLDRDTRQGPWNSSRRSSLPTPSFAPLRLTSASSRGGSPVPHSTCECMLPHRPDADPLGGSRVPAGAPLIEPSGRMRGPGSRRANETAQRRAEADGSKAFPRHKHRPRPEDAFRATRSPADNPPRLGDPAVHLERAEARADALERLIGAR